MQGISYFERHWRGELPLGLSCLVNHLIIGGIAWQLAALGVRQITQRAGEQALPCFCFALSIFILLSGVQLWQIGGTWRAAGLARRRSRPLRAITVQTLLVLSVAGMVLLPLATLVPMAQAAVAGRPVPVTGAVLRQGGRVLEFRGPIDKTSPDALRQLLDTAQVERVRLDSLGGLVAPARVMAEMIRVRGLDTEVAQRCASACTIVFFAGRHRLIEGDGALGFHSYSSTAETPQAILQQENRDRETYLAGGVAPYFVDQMFNVPPAQVWYPARSDVEAAGFATD